MPCEGEDQESTLELIIPLCSQQVRHPESFVPFLGTSIKDKC